MPFMRRGTWPRYVAPPGLAHRSLNSQGLTSLAAMMPPLRGFRAVCRARIGERSLPRLLLVFPSRCLPFFVDYVSRHHTTNPGAYAPGSPGW